MQNVPLPTLELRTPVGIDRITRYEYKGGIKEARPAEAEVWSISLEKAEEPKVPTARAIDPHLEEARHLAVHGLPVATAAEGRWRSGGDHVQNREQV